MGLRKWGGLRVWGEASDSVYLSINSTLPSLISSVEIQYLSGGKVAAISSTMPSLVSSATFDTLEPSILSASISSILPSLTSNVHFYNGILDVRIGKGNNINIQTKSRII